ncbi:MAG: tetratricopeptide repeat protein, partial [Terriglobales bacterium]
MYFPATSRSPFRSPTSALTPPLRKTPAPLFPFILILALATTAATQPPAASPPQADVNHAAQAAYQAGNTAIKNNDWKTAEAQFEKVVHLVPQIEEGHSSLGAVLIRLGKFPQAIKELEKAVALKPADIAAQTNLALAYEQTGAYKKAVATFAKLEADSRRKSPSNPLPALPTSLLEPYARALAATGQLPDAISKMKAAVAAEPQNAELHDSLGTLQAQQQNWT